MGNIKLFLAILARVFISIEGGYQIGLARFDVTGPSVQVPFMGYGSPAQVGHGINTRQYARAFIVEDEDGERVVFVNVDIGMISHALRRDIVASLVQRFGNLYTLNNVMLAPTHTHGGPGGYHQLVLYDVTCGGFIRENYVVIVDGITQAIVNAHNSMFSGRIFYSEFPVSDFGVNRSPKSYDANADKDQYEENIDRNMQQIRFVNEEGEIVGAFNWLAIHAVSMNNTNSFVSSDNLGYSSLLLEQEYNPGQLIGKGDFIGAFSTSNSGDISPNTLGPRCISTGSYCDALQSTCPNEDPCIAFGPGNTHMESTRIIGTRMYDAASQELKQSPQRELTGKVGFVNQYVEMAEQSGTWFNKATQQVESFRGCLSAMGLSFGAGTTDGPGAPFFHQGQTEPDPFWESVRDTMAAPTDDDIACHFPKPILLMTGRMTTPYLWQPQSVPTQIIAIGDAVILGIPGEATTMAGRRLRSDIKALGEQLGKNLEVITSGMVNTYASYIVTWEEYQVQRYEAASTPYGPHTLTILQQQFSKLYTAMVNNTILPPGPLPPDQTLQQITLLTPRGADSTGPEGAFGTCIVQPNSIYRKGEEVFATFVAGNPRNNLMIENSYFTVQQLQENGNWDPVATDANWETRFIWRQTNSLLGRSEIDFYWDIPQSVENGIYRVRHDGASRGLLTGVRDYTGFTHTFKIVTSRNLGLKMA